MILAPSILSFDPGDLNSAVVQLMEAGVEWIHLDIMDGQFVPPITFGADLASRLRQLGPVPLEAHLMTLTPERHFDALLEAGCTRIILHHEATVHAHYHCIRLRERGVQAGVAINPSTPVESLRPLLGVMDLALVMTVNPGWGGQPLIEGCLEKVQTLRAWAPELEIEVDGGIDDQTLRLARAAGATTVVSGSFLSKAPSIAAGVAALRRA